MARPIYAEYRAPADDRTVAVLRRQWRNSAGQVELPELPAANFNPVWGVTCNPGISSAPPEVLRAAQRLRLRRARSWLANGSCLGGSLRIPASFCGIVGMRPAPAWCAGRWIAAFDSLWVDGPMARNRARSGADAGRHGRVDAARPAVASHSAGRFPGDAEACAASAAHWVQYNLGLRSIDPEVARLCHAGTRAFTAMGCAVEEEAPDFSGAIDSFQVLRALLFADVRGDLLPRERAAHQSRHRLEHEKGQQLTAGEIIRAQRERHAAIPSCGALF